MRISKALAPATARLRAAHNSRVEELQDNSTELVDIVNEQAKSIAELVSVLGGFELRLRYSLGLLELTRIEGKYYLRVLDSLEQQLIEIDTADVVVSPDGDFMLRF